MTSILFSSLLFLAFVPFSIAETSPENPTVLDGAKEEKASVPEAPKGPRSNWILGVEGIKDYKQLEQIKSQLVMKLEKGSTFFEKQVTRGYVDIALQTRTSLETLAQHFNGLQIENTFVQVLKTDPERKMLVVRVQ